MLKPPMFRRSEGDDDAIAPKTDKLQYDNDLKLSNEDFDSVLSSIIQRDSKKTAQQRIRDVAAYPQPYIFAQFAKLAYSESDDLERREGESDKDYKKRVGIPDGWSLLTMAKNNSTSNGYVGAVFINGDARQIMIAHRGTKPGIGSFWTDLKSIYGNNYGAQMNSACTLAHRVSTSLKKLFPDGKFLFDLFFTGHSLGAWLSQISTMSLKYLTVVDNKFLKNPNMEAGISAHTEVFESPGAKDMLIKIINDFDARYADRTIDYEYLDITTYLSSPNQINCCNSHVGKLYRIYPIVDTDSGWFGAYSIASHSIDGILKTFDTRTGFFQKDEEGILKINKVVDWPVIYGTIYSNKAEYDEFFKWAKLQNNFTPDEHSATFITAVEKGHGYVIRYQTKAYRDDKCSWNVFNQSEVSFLYSYQTLRSVPEFYHPETLFEDDKDHYIENNLKEISMNKRSVTFKVAARLRQLIPFVRILLQLYPELKTKAKHDLSSVAARTKVYDNATKEYTGTIQPFVSLFQDDKFPEVQTFFENASQNVLHISAENYSDFVMSRIVKTVRDDKQFDLEVVMDLSKFTTLEKSFKLEEVLESDMVKKPLVVLDCKIDSQHEDEDAKDLMEAFANFLKDSTKLSYKIILVTIEDNVYKLTDNIRDIGRQQLGGKFNTIRNNGLDWSILTPEARENILNDDVITFQGLKKEVSFNYLFNDKQRSQSYFDSLTLANIIKKNDVKIGQDLPRKLDLEEFFIPRILQQAKPQVQQTLFQHLEPKIKVVITGSVPREPSTKFLYDSSQVTIIKSRDDYLKLVQSGFDVHWLNYEAGTFTLIDTTNLEKLRKFLKKGPLAKFDEKEVLGFFSSRKTVVLADKAGMGKTSVVTELSRKLRENNPRKWIMRVNFVDCTRVFKEAQNQGDKDRPLNWIVKFMTEQVLECNESTKLRTRLEKQIFEDSLMKYGNLIIFFDGFDEITPDYEDIALKMLKALENTKIDTVFVTTRRHTKDQLENVFNTLSFNLKPFSEDNQVEFLVEFWKKRLGSKAPSETDLTRHAKNIVEVLKVNNDEDDDELLGVPLLCRLTGEFMLENVESGDTTVLRDGLSLLELYETFVSKKLELYRKLNNPRDDTVSSENRNKIIETLIRYLHHKFALELLLTKETYDSFHLNEFDNLMEPLEAEVMKSGLMTYTLHKPHFIHRTFAEYFLYDYSLVLIQESNRHSDTKEQLTNLSREILLNNGLLVVRSFYENNSVRNLKLRSGLAPLILNPYFEFVIANWSTKKPECLNAEEETALQVLIREGHDSIATSLLNLIKKSNDFLDVKSFINNKDLKNHLTALHYAARYGFNDVIETLISLGALVEDPSIDAWAPLHFAAMYNHPISASILISKGAKIDVLFNLLKTTPLHLAAMKGNYEVVQVLMNHKANVMARDILDKTPLHQAAGSDNVQGSINVIEELLKNGAEINAVDVEGNTPLHISTKDEYVDITKTLVENGADIDAKNNNGDSPMMTAAFSPTVLYLISKGADIKVVNLAGDTILLKAASRYGFADVVRELLAKGADKSLKNKEGETPLDIAKKNGREDIIKILS